MTNWQNLAKEYLESEKLAVVKQVPPGTAALIEWHGENYIGGVQEIAPDFSKEIVLLGKSSIPIKIEFRKAILDLDKEHLILLADDRLDLEGTSHVVRRLENRLAPLTDVQMLYVQTLELKIVEQNTGRTLQKGSPILYGPNYGS